MRDALKLCVLSSLLAALLVPRFARAAEPPWLEVTPFEHQEQFNEQYFGQNAALWGNVAVVGGSDATVGQNEAQGVVYTYQRSSSSSGWQRVGVPLTAADGAKQDGFGGSIALWQNTLAVAASEKSIDGSFRSGAVYIFERQGDTWLQRARLTAPTLSDSESFGSPLALVGNVLVVGSNRELVYTFVKRGSDWVQQGNPLRDPESDHYFGRSFALSAHPADLGGRLIIGAPAVLDSKAKGGASIYALDALGRWQLEARLASPFMPPPSFGSSVAIYGDSAFVADGEDAGTVTIFMRSAAGAWSSNTAYGGDQGYFGAKMSIWGNQALVAAPSKQFAEGTGQGGLLVFERKEQTWIGPITEWQRVAPNEGRSVGQCLALSGPNAVTGAHDIDGASYALRVCASGVCCSADSECASDQYCAFAGTCQPRVAAGDACDCFEPGCRVCLESTCGECALPVPPLVEPSAEAGSAGEENAAGSSAGGQAGTAGMVPPRAGGSSVAGAASVGGSVSRAGSANVAGASSGAPAASGGVPNESDESSSASCGCRAAPSSSNHAPSALVALGVALLVRRRRTRGAALPGSARS